jgi:hypothetical protein
MKKTSKKKTMHCPPIPIGHLTITQFAELKKQVLKITGHEIVLVAKDKTGKILFKE